MLINAIFSLKNTQIIHKNFFLKLSSGNNKKGGWKSNQGNQNSSENVT